MEHLDKKSFLVSRGFTYAYYHGTATSNQPTALLIHGFPDTADVWTDVVTNWLQPNGYGLVAIDCLGYGGTSKPCELTAYKVDAMTQDIMEILDNESLDKVVVIGHDWGSYLAHRVHSFHPDRVSGVVFINGSYIPPLSQPFSLDAMNKVTQQVFGHGLYWYWKFFVADDCADILHSHLESFWTACHGYPKTWLDLWCQPDGMRNFVAADKRQPTLPYATEARKQAFVERIQRDGINGPLNWYRSMTFGLQNDCEMAIPRENSVIRVPVLHIGGLQDEVCRTDLMQGPVDNGLVPHLKQVTVDTGHWSLLANPRIVGETLLMWLKETFT